MTVSESGQPSEHGATEQRRWTCAHGHRFTVDMETIPADFQAILRVKCPACGTTTVRPVEVVEAGTPGDREALSRDFHERLGALRREGLIENAAFYRVSTVFQDWLAALSAPVTEPGQDAPCGRCGAFNALGDLRCCRCGHVLSAVRDAGEGAN